ncbi:MAG: hypothetical protein MUO21_09845, partial [Nitrososphaeraceae archaeon]|nr:hypothetical protein [Nitrososphaeraceae archaeon]
MIASFHVEALCQNRFYPNSKNDADKVSLIATTFHRIVDGKYEHVCDCVFGLENQDERWLLLKWINLIKEKKVTLLIGWYIFGFDFIYLQERAEKLGILNKLSELGLVKTTHHRFYIQSTVNKLDLMFYLEHQHIVGNLFEVLKRYNIPIPILDNGNTSKYALDCCLAYFELYKNQKNDHTFILDKP